MRKPLYQQYLLLILILLVIVIIPKSIQQVFRSQFLRPLIPFSSLINSKTELIANSQKKTECKFKEAPRTYMGGAVANIIYRSPAYWNSFFWIDIGSQNAPKELQINSPVLHDGQLIGAVDYIGKKHARVQLLTSSNLTLSVQAQRGQHQYFDVVEYLDALLDKDVIQENAYLYDEIKKQSMALKESGENQEFAIGEISGMSLPLWRSHANLLQGRGFYSKGDRCGCVVKGDLLVTTGFDGVFPKGLPVARVTDVNSLESGDYYYTLQAAPTAKNLNQINQIEVISPVEFQPYFKSALDYSWGR